MVLLANVLAVLKPLSCADPRVVIHTDNLQERCLFPGRCMRRGFVVWYAGGAESLEPRER